MNDPKAVIIQFSYVDTSKKKMNKCTLQANTNFLNAK